MKNWLFIAAVIIALLIVTYNPAVKTLTGEVQHVEVNELHITCPKQQPRFKPADDIGYSCTIFINEQTIIEPAEPLEVGQTVSVELVNKVKIDSTKKHLVAAKITILEQ